VRQTKPLRQQQAEHQQYGREGTLRVSAWSGVSH
jgi:hypothetical protein